MCPAQVLSRLFISKSILSGLQAWLNRICRPSYTKMRHLTPVLGGGPVSPGSQVPSALVKELKGAWWNPEQLRKHTESSTLPWHAYEFDHSVEGQSVLSVPSPAVPGPFPLAARPS